MLKRRGKQPKKLKIVLDTNILVKPIFKFYLNVFERKILSEYTVPTKK
jgi:hypothetical protein